MSEEIKKGLEQSGAKLETLPPEDAAALMREAADRVNVVADYLKTKDRLEKA